MNISSDKQKTMEAIKSHMDNYAISKVSEIKNKIITSLGDQNETAK